MARTEEKETRWRTLGPPNRRQFSPMADVSNRIETSSSGRDDRPLCYFFKKGSFLKGISEIADIHLSGILQKRSMQSLRELSCRPSQKRRASAPYEKSAQVRYVKDSSGTAKKNQAGGNSLSETNEKTHDR